MKKFLPFSKRQPSLDRYSVSKAGWAGSDRCNGKSMRRISATSLNTKSIQVVRGAYNIDLNKVDSSFTKLHRACLLNDDAQVRKHIYKVDNNLHDSSKRYPIHLATVNGNFAIVKLLIENKANPNVQDNEENTPLIKSIECGHEHLVKYLLNNDADPNLSDQDNNTALHWAIITESMIAIEALLSSKKCDLSLINSKDETPLHLAVRSSLINLATYETLLKQGSDITAKDQLGLTASEIAQACHNEVAMNALAEFNNNSNIDIISSPAGEIIATNDPNSSSMKICEEYKLQYINKNQENLEYERRLIQLNAQIERLKLDMSFMREQNEKLESDFERLKMENSKLKIDNSNLLEHIDRIKREEHKAVFPDLDMNKIKSDSNCLRTTDLVEIDSIECKGHEEFLSTKAYLQERINNLKYGLDRMQT